MESVRASLAAPPLYRLTSRILIHDRSPEGSPPCACCGSHSATVSEILDDLDLLLHVESGLRIHRASIPAHEWDALAAQAKHLEIPIRISRPQLPVAISEDRLVLTAGGAQSGKTEAAARWFVRQLLLRGGRGRTFWVLAPSRRSAFLAAQKALLGYQGRPGVLPPELVASAPRHDREDPLRISLVDGTQIDLRPCDRADGSRADGQECQAVWLDEVAKIRWASYLEEAQARVTATSGPVCASTVPKKGHWSEDVYRSHPSTTLTRFDNYYVPTASIREQEKILSETRGKSVVQRDIYGQWEDPDASPYWFSFDAERHVLQRVPLDLRLAHDPQGRPWADITAHVAKKIAPGGNWFVPGFAAQNLQYLIGMDVNLSPCTAIIAKVVALDGVGSSPEQWGVVVVDEVSAQRATLEEFGQNHLGRAQGGAYRSSLVFLDPQNCHRTQSRSGNQSGRALLHAGFDARPAATSIADGKRIPGIIPRVTSHYQVHQLLQQDRLWVSSKCVRLLEAFDRQELDPSKDLPKKEPNTESDRLSNAMDGLRYLLAAIFPLSQRPQVPKNSTTTSSV